MGTKTGSSINRFTFEPFSGMLSLLTFGETKYLVGHKGGGPALEWAFDYSFTPFGRYQINDNPCWRKRQAFEAHLLPPGTIVREDSFGNTVKGGIHSIFLTFTHGENAGLLPMTQPSGYARFLDPGRKVCSLLERMHTEINELKQQGFWIAQCLLWEIFMLLHHSLHVDNETFLIIPESPFLSSHSDLVRRVRYFFLAHIGGEITLDALAEHLNLSTSSVYKRYKKETGVAPMTDLHKIRVEYVKMLILKGYRLRNIAKEIGFCDEFHLSKVFKSVEGISPSEFRKNNLDEIKIELGRNV